MSDHANEDKEEFEDVEQVEEFEQTEPEAFTMDRSAGQYVSTLIRYLLEAVVLVLVLYLLTPVAQRESVSKMGVMAVTIAAVLVLLDLFGGMGLAARLGAGLGVGFRLAGVTALAAL